MHSGRNERKQRHEQSVKRNYIRFIGYGIVSVMVLTLFGAYALACSFVYVAPSLPSVEAMRNVEMQVPLRVFTRSGELIAQIGEQRRIPVALRANSAPRPAGLPRRGRRPLLRARRRRLLRHPARGAGEPRVRRQGAGRQHHHACRPRATCSSRWTRPWRRKLRRLFVTWRMEREFTKQEILGLYLNVIYLRPARLRRGRRIGDLLRQAAR